MTRRNLPHFQIGNRWYFITFRTKRLILTPDARDEVARAIMYGHNKEYRLAVAVVMPDHVHMLLLPVEKEDGSSVSLQEIIQPVKSVSSHRINKLLKRKGALWQDERFDRIVMDEDEWQEKYKYITENAIKAELVVKPEDYKWLLSGEELLRKY